MTQADHIISKFGTQTALADAIKVRQSAVAAWKKRGLIPAHQHPRILEAAAVNGVDLEMADFFGHELPEKYRKPVRAA